MGTPRVVVGLPVYNSQKYIEAAIESHLSQSFGDFELLISDNASTDATFEICTAYAARDRRVKVVRAPQNQGILWNHRKVLEGITRPDQYFRWAGGDDIVGPGLLQDMVNILDRRPEVFAASPDTRNIDDFGTETGAMPRSLDFQDADVVQRARSALLADYQHVMAYGLLRAGPLLQMRTGAHYPGWDTVFLWELVLRGLMVQTEGTVLYRRFHAGSISRVKSLSEKRKWVEPKAKAGMSFPHWKWSYERFRVLLNCPMSTQDRWRIGLFLLRFTSWQRGSLTNDLAQAAKRGLRLSDRLTT